MRKSRISFALLGIIVTTSAGYCKELDRYYQPMCVSDFFANTPPWVGPITFMCGHWVQKDPEVVLDRNLMPNCILHQSCFVLSSSSDVRLETQFPLFSLPPRDMISLLPVPQFHGWTFELIPSPTAPVSSYLLNENMNAAEFCRQNMNAAIAIYRKAAPLLSKNFYGIDYISDLYSELGLFSELLPLARKELDWISHPRAWKTKLPTEHDDPEHRADLAEYQKEYSARLQGHFCGKMLNGYYRSAKPIEARQMERLAMRLDKQFPSVDIYESIAQTYIDLGEYELARKIIREAISTRLRKYGGNHEYTKRAEEYQKEYARYLQ